MVEGAGGPSEPDGVDVAAKGDPVNEDIPCDDVSGNGDFEAGDAFPAPEVDNPVKKGVELVPSVRFSVPAIELLNCHVLDAADFSASFVDAVEVAPFTNGELWPLGAKGPDPLAPGENLIVLVEASNIPG